jgi:hypothetical protein
MKESIEMELTPEMLQSRLKEGDILELKGDGGAFQVWAEIFASPPTIYYEGEPYPLSEFDAVIEQIIKAVTAGEYRARWVDE